MNIALGEALPFHEVDLVEIKQVDSPKYKENFYAMLLGYCKEKGKTDKYALAIFRQRFDAWPYNKKHITPTPPDKEVKDYITSRNIAYAKRKK